MDLRTINRNPIFSGVLFALLYILVARLSLNLAFQQSNATPIWPPSGLAIAFIFLFGKKATPAIFAGAFITNLILFTSNSPISFEIICCSLLIGFGNSMEALITYSFYKLGCENDKPLTSPVSFSVFLSVSIASSFACAFFATFVLFFFNKTPFGRGEGQNGWRQTGHCCAILRPTILEKQVLHSE